jgi:hypothetical protein
VENDTSKHSSEPYTFLQQLLILNSRNYFVVVGLVRHIACTCPDLSQRFGRRNRMEQIVVLHNGDAFVEEWVKLEVGN